jgi:aminoglycoside 3-N-acetyltransferase
MATSQVEIAARPWLSARIKQMVKAWLKQARLGLIRRLRGFDSNDLIDGLRRLGVEPGQVIMVHSSFDQFEGFEGKPSDIIDALQQAVGPDGTVMMPTIPFTGSAIDYVKAGTVFDVRRTPSKMGLVTEIFRRSPDVVRSVHPTHAVAARGARSHELTADHGIATTPCGVGSPFAKLLDHNGKTLLLGTGIGAMTFYHTCEELLEKELPFSPFTAETYTVKSKDGNGSEVTTTMRLFDPTWSRRRNLQRLVPALRERGAWHSTRIGTLEAILLDAQAVLEACRAMARQGQYCYDD